MDESEKLLEDEETRVSVSSSGEKVLEDETRVSVSADDVLIRLLCLSVVFFFLRRRFL